MSLLLSGTNGLSDVDGSAATPAVRGTDSNTGIFFPAADTIAFAEGGAEVARFDSSGNLGIGTTTPQGKLDVSSSSAGVSAGDLVVDTVNKIVYVGRLSSTSGDNAKLMVRNRVGDAITITSDTSPTGTGLYRPGSNLLGFTTNGSERMRIDSSGNVLVGVTSFSNGVDGKSIDALVYGSSRSSTGSANHCEFRNPNGQVGTISTSGSSTTYSTSSDYRLKENIAPMTGALGVVSQLKPVTYTWKSDGSAGQGFIAHELQAVVPDCVTGEKDATKVVNIKDEEGNVIGQETKPVYQGIDTSFLVATLTAAIQEQQAIISDLKARIETLEQSNAS